MHKEKITVNGKAYLIGGDKKATLALIDAFASMSKDKAAAKLALESRFIVKFDFPIDKDVPDNRDEAIAMLPNGWETVDSLIFGQCDTNQRDKARAARAAEIVKEKQAETDALLANASEIVKNIGKKS